MKKLMAIPLVLSVAISVSAEAGNPVEGLLETYRGEGAAAFDPRAGAELWVRSFTHAKAPANRSCASCHTDDPSRAGRHLRTRKLIDPMAPSANPDRLQDVAEIRKWLKRNCRWTLGRECTAQEKGDLLTFLNSQ
jgi:mono/diheme cytochrome c family protein